MMVTETREGDCEWAFRSSPVCLCVDGAGTAWHECVGSKNCEHRIWGQQQQFIKGWKVGLAQKHSSTKIYLTHCINRDREGKAAASSPPSPGSVSAMCTKTKAKRGIAPTTKDQHHVRCLGLHVSQKERECDSKSAPRTGKKREEASPPFPRKSKEKGQPAYGHPVSGISFPYTIGTESTYPFSCCVCGKTRHGMLI